MPDFSALRTAMVDCQVRPSDVTKFPIIDAMLAIPREGFVPAALRDIAYAGGDLNLGDGRVVLDPRVFAKMLDALAIGSGDMVLEIGAGHGYGTAVLAHMAEAVIAVETDEAMAGEAENNLSEQGVDNAFVVAGDLTAGAEKHGPYDAILIEGGVEAVPAALLAQLKDNGRIGAIFMEGPQGHFRIGLKSAGKISWRTIFDATCPVLPGFERKPTFAL